MIEFKFTYLLSWPNIRAGQTSYDVALGTTKYLTRETTYIPWYTATAALGEIGSMISYRETYGSYQVSN